MKPKLTRPRWRALKTLANCDGPFFGADLGIKGPTLVSLEKCGWVERMGDVPLGTMLPFYTKETNGHYWRVTDAGRAAIAVLPETAPRRM
jgi:hypothetical protein